MLIKRYTPAMVDRAIKLYRRYKREWERGEWPDIYIIRHGHSFGQLAYEIAELANDVSTREKVLDYLVAEVRAKVLKGDKISPREALGFDLPNHETPLTPLGRYQADMTRLFDFEIAITNTPQTTVKEADIIVTAGPFLAKPAPVIEFDWIKKGAFVCPLDLDSYVKPEVFQKSDFICTDDIGQFQHFRSTGLFKSCPENIADLAGIITGQIKGRKSSDDVITSINIGIALEDMSVAPLIYKKAREKNIGVWLDL